MLPVRMGRASPTRSAALYSPSSRTSRRICSIMANAAKMRTRPCVSPFTTPLGIPRQERRRKFFLHLPLALRITAAFIPGAAEPMVPFTLTPRKNWLIMRTMALMRSSSARSHSLRDTRSRSHRVTCESYNGLKVAEPLPWIFLAFSSPLQSV